VGKRRIEEAMQKKADRRKKSTIAEDARASREDV
jgi:hypothetical protein